MLLTKQPKTFVIALKDHLVSQKQLDDCIASGKKYGWQLETFWGIYGNTLTSESWADKKITCYMDRAGQQGCFFSHLLLWERCINLNEPIIVLEHDAVIQDLWKPIDVVNSLIKLHRHYRKDPMSNKWVHPVTGRWSPSTHAYCLTPNHAKTLISSAQRLGAFPADVFMGSNVINVKLLGEPELVARQNTFSTTGHL